MRSYPTCPNAYKQKKNKEELVAHLEGRLAQLKGELRDDNNGGKDGAVLSAVVAVDLLQSTKLLEAPVDGLVPGGRLGSCTFIRK